MKLLNNQFAGRIKEIKPFEPTYHFLQVINKEDDENILSSWLAFILDGKKIGSYQPFAKLCEYLNIDVPTQNIDIRREYYLDNKRRIDLLIKTEKVWIVIENKINSFECKEQTKDYAEKIDLETKGRDILIKYIYLKPDYSRSMPVETRFEVLTYGTLFKIYRNIGRDDFFDDERYFYFKEFLKIIKEEYAMSQELKFDEGVEFYLSYKEEIESVQRSFQNACQIVKSKLLSAIRGVFPEEETWIVRPMPVFIQVAKQNWNGIYFEIATWDWQKKMNSISLDRIIANDVILYFHLNIDKKQHLFDSKIPCEFAEDKNYFCERHYGFDTEDQCLESIEAIAEHLKLIKGKFAEQIDLMML